MRLVVDSIDLICDSGHGTEKKKIGWHKQRYSSDPIYSAGSDIGEIDVSATMAKSKYPIGPDDLIKKTREIIQSEFGTKAGSNPDDLLAEDFQFVAPIVGPLRKDEFLRAFGGFKLRDAVPDFVDNVIFQVDPLEPNRCWFISRSVGTHTGPLMFGGKTIAPTNKKIYMPPQASSMLFDEEGKCYTLTVGYTMDKRIGNTNGLGALFGILYAVGHPIPCPEAKALYNPSLRFESFLRLAGAFDSFNEKGTKTA